MTAYQIRNERRIYPVTEDEYSLLTLAVEGRRDNAVTPIAIELEPGTARLTPHWHAYEIDLGKVFVVYGEGCSMLFVRRKCDGREPGIYTYMDPNPVEYVTCRVCLCDHKKEFCGYINPNLVCPDCHQEILRANALEHANEYIYRKRQATPKWADLEEIEKVYAEARRRTLETGIPHHVDHIVPIRGKECSGLHVHWNLQVLTAEENIRKSNKLLARS